MNILMMTNTFTPHVGGVARSVAGFTAEYRKRGHRVLVVTPEFNNMPANEVDVVRIPAIQNFNGSDFSVVLPVSGFLSSAIEEFKPDIVHSHHPFLIGSTALRIAHMHQLPLVFTHHTMYEQYTHYVPGDSKAMQRFVIKLSTSYANLCDQVFAPSESIATVLRKRGVKIPLAVIPTGVHLERFAQGDGQPFRARMNIPQDAFVVGHLGRLAPEKNLEFLAQALVTFGKSDKRAHFLIVGEGPSKHDIRRIFSQAGISERLHMVGILEHNDLISAYCAMDVFAFTSKSETQGMVLVEAMAAGVPVVALDAPGVREVVVDYKNGRLLTDENVIEFSSALQWLTLLPSEKLLQLKQHVAKTADAFSMSRSVDKALEHFEKLLDQAFISREGEYSTWSATLHLIQTEWDLLKSMAGAAGAALNIVQTKNKIEE